MKPFYDQEVHFTASTEELQILRVSVARSADKLRTMAEIPADWEYINKLEQIYTDLTKILESLPF